MKAYYPIIGILFFIGLFSNTANAQIIDTETPSAAKVFVYSYAGAPKLVYVIK